MRQDFSLTPEFTDVASAFQHNSMGIPVSESTVKAAHTKGADIALKGSLFLYIISNSLYNNSFYMLLVW